jgi:hypothetical protein
MLTHFRTRDPLLTLPKFRRRFTQNDLSTDKTDVRACLEAQLANGPVRSVEEILNACRSVFGAHLFA